MFSGLRRACETGADRFFPLSLSLSARINGRKEGFMPPPETARSPSQSEILVPVSFFPLHSHLADHGSNSWGYFRPME